MNSTSTFACNAVVSAAIALAAGLYGSNAYAQPANYTNTVTYKHNKYIGQDATVWELHNGATYCVPSGQTVSPALQNFGNDPVGSFMAWTWNAVGCPNGTTRFFIRFPQLSLLATSAAAAYTVTVTSATLTLHGVGPADLPGTYGNSAYPGSPFPPDNGGKLWKVAAGNANAWREDNITWANALGLTMDASIPAVPIMPTNSRYNFDQSFDVTAMVNRIVRDASGYLSGSTWVPASNFANNGFMLQLGNESTYRGQFYATSDNANAALWPELTVTYAVESRCRTLTDPSFSYTTANTNPLVFTFSANSPSFAAGYQWYVVPASSSINFGTPVGSGTPFTYTFPSAGVYNIAMTTRCEDDVVPRMATVAISLTNGVYQSPQKAEAIPDGTTPVTEGDNNNRVLPGDEPSAMHSGLSPISATPNPTDDHWTISLNASNAMMAQVTLYNASGKRITETTRQLHTGINRFDLQAKQLPAGLYLLDIRGGSLNLQQKLIRR